MAASAASESGTGPDTRSLSHNESNPRRSQESTIDQKRSAESNGLLAVLSWMPTLTFTSVGEHPSVIQMF
jgi:hypothetical protein